MSEKAEPIDLAVSADELEQRILALEGNPITHQIDRFLIVLEEKSRGVVITSEISRLLAKRSNQDIINTVREHLYIPKVIQDFLKARLLD